MFILLHSWESLVADIVSRVRRQCCYSNPCAGWNAGQLHMNEYLFCLDYFAVLPVIEFRFSSGTENDTCGPTSVRRYFTSSLGAL